MFIGTREFLDCTECPKCLYEYVCDWSKAGNELRCEDWKPEGEQEKER